MEEIKILMAMEFEIKDIGTMKWNEIIQGGQWNEITQGGQWELKDLSNPKPIKPLTNP